MNTTQQPEALNLEEFRAKVTHAAREPLLARIAELEAQLSAIGAGGVELLRKRNVGDSEDNLTMASAIIMQREADARDAARYRWLRNQMLGVDFYWGENKITALCFEMPEDGCAYGGDCDQNIDAAIAAQAKQGGAA